MYKIQDMNLNRSTLVLQSVRLEDIQCLFGYWWNSICKRQGILQIHELFSIGFVLNLTFLWNSVVINTNGEFCDITLHDISVSITF